jgi:iron-sulfur cluster assembly protein
MLFLLSIDTQILPEVKNLGSRLPGRQRKVNIEGKVITNLLSRSLQIMTQAPSPTKSGIELTESALSHVKALRDQQGNDLCLRVGVRQGGCSGMSYLMEFEDISNARPDDEIFDYDGFKLVCDRKSLLYIYGLVLDYSNAMIGGGFQFTNPNASQSCGCGKSFAV